MSGKSSQQSDRRAFLTVAAVLPLAMHRALPELSSNPDAELIQAARRFAELERQYQFICNEAGLSDEDTDELVEQMRPERAALLQKVVTMRATTWEGHLARARAAFIYTKDVLDKEATSGAWNELLVWSVLRDMADVKGGPQV